MSEQTTLVLHLDQIPSGTAQQKRTNRRTGAFFESETIRRARTIYTALLLPYRPKVPYEAPLRVTVTFAYSIKDKKKRGKWKTCTPDCDNLVKLFLDCMTACGFWKDDAAIADLRIQKVYHETDEARIYVRIKEIGGERWTL